MDFVLLALLLVVLLVLAVVLHKVRKIHLVTYRLLDAAEESEVLYHQFQAYDSLMRLLKPTGSLPLLRGWAASPDLLLTIASHMKKSQPQAILECSSGSSTLVMARCCQLNNSGHVYSLEHDKHYAEQTREWLSEQELDDWATVIHAPLVPTGESGQPWYDLSQYSMPEDGFDMLVIDGPPATSASLARYPALPQLDKMLKSGSIIFLDDARRAEERRILERWRQEFPGYVQVLLPLDKGAAILTKN